MVVVVILIVTRSDSTEAGLELAYLCIGIVTVVLVGGFYDPAALRKRREEEGRATAR